MLRRPQPPLSALRGSVAPSPERGARERVLVARQPIVDGSHTVRGYELLFRRTARVERRPEAWTASLLVGAVADLGLEAIVGDALAYVNVSRDFLLDVDPLPFGPEGIVLELTEDSHTPEPELLERLRGLRSLGYTIALDDFAHDPALEPLVELANIVKLDILADGLERTAEQARALAPFGVTLLAEKVETAEEFEACAAMGCELFQGYFFARPRVLAGTLDADADAGLAVIGELLRPDLAREELESIIGRDVALSYKLLRYVNSGFFARARTLDSVREAIIFLGERTVRQWAVVMSLAGGGRPSPALVSLALLRARLCQQVAEAGGIVAPDKAFMAGMFSVVDALLGVPMEVALARLPFGDELTGALVAREGRLGEILGQVTAIERGSLDVLGELAAGSYGEASEWADGLARMAP